jgi:trehalose synthase
LFGLIGENRVVAALENVRIGSLRLERFESVLAPERYEAVRVAAERGRRLLEGRVVWNVNSTARGGGVAEMLISLLAYAKGAGVDARWVVIPGTAPFFEVTKRIHNNLHSAAGDGGELGAHERGVYERALAPSVEEFAELVNRRDVVIVHDPQPAGLIPRLKQIGVPVIWRCHVGIDNPSALSRRAWSFLKPYVEPADAYVFSREAFVWDGLERAKIELIAPVIDAFSAKNQELDERAVAAILGVAGLGDDGNGEHASFVREDGSPALVHRQAQLREERPLRASDPIILQVSRWDTLKDPLGVIQGFVEYIAPHTDAHLVYAGPAVDAVSDDPEGAGVLQAAEDYIASVERSARERVHLACLPMDDLAENAAIVNALQRRADIVVQKSTAEGFGLTVAEAMWKARPVVASKIGGIQDQIIDGISGVLLENPTDLRPYATAVTKLLQQPTRAHEIGQQAQQRVRDHYLSVRSLIQYIDLITRLPN